jgi:two-component system chemotaxis response regulator CheB
MSRRVSVLIVDDSAVVRQTLSEILSTDPGIEIFGTAADPYIAAKRMKDGIPDVMTLDVEMPRMDGLTFLEKIMKQHPMPVVMCSSLSEKGCSTGMRALELGAVDIITKPKMGVKEFLEDSRVLLCDAVKAAAGARVRRVTSVASMPVEEKLTADAVLHRAPHHALIETTEKVIVVGASTGGTAALTSFLQSMPRDCPGILIVQHMPEKFTASFADRLNVICEISVKEASNGDGIWRGRALIAPGGRHLLLRRSGAQYYAEVRDGPLVSRHRPSVDVLFRSAASFAGPNAVGVIMTGMGDDGAKGMLELKEAGAATIAQDEQTSVVFGMPKEAIALGAIDRVLPLDRIGPEAVRSCR